MNKTIKDNNNIYANNPLFARLKIANCFISNTYKTTHLQVLMTDAN